MHNVIKCKNMFVEYCPTGDMCADVLTKPLHGQTFRKMRSKLINMPEVYVEDETPILMRWELKMMWIRLNVI